jgi:Flp pilus assembly pilin Flp
MRTEDKNYLGDESGASVAEYALILGLLVLHVMLIVIVVVDVERGLP